MSYAATVPEIVACFDALDSSEILNHNWGTCGRDCPASWDVNDETYINGVILTLDFDYIMGYLVEAVNRTSRTYTYVAIVHYHGRRPDGTFDHDFASWDGNTNVEQEVVAQWAVSVIYGMVEARMQARYKEES